MPVIFSVRSSDYKNCPSYLEVLEGVRVSCCSLVCLVRMSLARFQRFLASQFQGECSTFVPSSLTSLRDLNSFVFVLLDRNLPHEGDAAQQAQVDLLPGLRLLRARSRRTSFQLRRQVFYRRNQEGWSWSVKSLALLARALGSNLAQSCSLLLEYKFD
jgi:hypothetical protein